MPQAAPPTAERTRANPRSTLISWLAVCSVTAGLFAIVTVEILPIGLLPAIGRSFDVTDGTAGLTMTMPGFLAALSAPLVTTATARVDRRIMLCAFMALLAAANLVVVVAPAYWLVLVSRVLVGVTIGGFWSIAAGLAGRLVPPESVARATAVIFSAVPLGSVLGVPLGTFVGEAAGWRTAFIVMGVLSVGVWGVMLAVLPPLPPGEVLRVSVLRAALRGPGTRWALLVTFLVVLAHFGAYTYVAPFLRRVTGVGPAVVTVFLLVYGAAGIAGNFLGGAVVARRPRAAFAGAAGLIAVAALLLPVLGDRPGGAVALLAVWGIAFGAVPVCSGAWFAAAVPRSPEAASVLFTASFQATLSLGALAGGAVVDRGSPSAVMVLGGLTAVLAVGAAGLRR
ncbi:MFS transporter [Streptomyces flavofungini]|uniref:MFS transporter n=1 Tax=Streptomyces flavofungini TaxID=68200 RepID=A0ABS0X9S7_9ACTN|nr:MFS transporter [Streptomyces flavofungini]MBJ3809947.1 MFS transporter [Streptomyces flavofungini]GHC53878.1 MFS transporter [Streptomyces flavofungini]